jgi:integrase
LGAGGRGFKSRLPDQNIPSSEGVSCLERRHVSAWRAKFVPKGFASLELVPNSRRHHFGSVRKLPSGRYQARYWHDGAMHAAPSTFRAKADAQAWLSTVETDLLRGSWVAPADGKVTFGEFAKAWLEKQHHLRPRTVELYGYLLSSHLAQAFGDRPLSAITTTEVTAWHRSLLERRPGTAPKAYRLLAQLMKAALDDNCIVRSPVAVKGASKEPAQEQAVPTVAEVDALSEAVPDRYKAMVVLAAWCALRFGELAALRRDRVDLVHNEIRVSETVTELGTGERFVGPPKTAAGRRTVAIPPHLLPIVEKHLGTVGPEADALLFPATQGGYISRIHFRQRVWLPALRATGLAYRFHDLRHSGFTWAAASGATVAELMHRAGHSTSATAMRYQHATRDRDQAIAKALSRLVEPAKVVPLKRKATGQRLAVPDGQR